MKQLIPMDEYGVFGDTQDVARVDSRFVAEFFEREHKNVLRSIEAILAPDSGFSKEFTELNFALSSYKDSTGRTLPCYALTRDGFTALAMGFTGKKAAHFKEHLERCAIGNAGKFGTTRESVAALVEQESEKV